MIEIDEKEMLTQIFWAIDGGNGDNNFHFIREQLYAQMLGWA